MKCRLCPKDITMNNEGGLCYVVYLAVIQENKPQMIMGKHNVPLGMSFCINCWTEALGKKV